MAEHMCMLYRQQVTTYQQRVNHGSVPFPSPPHSALPLTLPKPAAFSYNCQPCVDNESAFSTTPDQSLNREDPQQQVNGSWSGNVHENSEPMSAPATRAATNGTASPYPSTTSPCQPLSSTSSTQPSQPPQQGQSAQLMGPGSSTRKKCPRVLCPCPNRANSVNSVRNQLDQRRKEKRHICDYPGCGKAFKAPYELQAHVIRMHNSHVERQFKCNWLSWDKRYATLEELKRHRHDIHTTEEKYACKQCSRRFKYKEHLRQHTKSHLKIQKGNETSLGKAVGSLGVNSSSSSVLFFSSYFNKYYQ